MLDSKASPNLSVLMKKNVYGGNVFLISMKARQSTSIVLQLHGVFPVLSLHGRTQKVKRKTLTVTRPLLFNISPFIKVERLEPKHLPKRPCPIVLI